MKSSGRGMDKLLPALISLKITDRWKIPGYTRHNIPVPGTAKRTIPAPSAKNSLKKNFTQRPVYEILKVSCSITLW